jgi:N-methylhydantoinase A
MIGVDVGGTFTDVVAIRDGTITTVKVPTVTPDTELGVLEGARAAGVSESQLFNHASTAGLNAILTRRLPKVAFLTTAGHRDILDMGRTWRPPDALTDPHWRRSFGDAARPLVPRYLRRGVQERITADGAILIPLSDADAREQLQVLKRCNVQGVAICLINAYINDEHERRLRELLIEELGPEVACSISSEVSPLAKEFARASTTVIDVLMKIIYGRYTDRLVEGLDAAGFTGQVNLADCASMLVPVDVAMRQPARIVFSGPAAGTISSAHFGGVIGEDNLLCADVGGTSCDISVVTNGRPFVNSTFELEHDLVVNALSSEISSIGAGGGSIISINATGEVRVGPESAGADPGPACYGRGGQEPTMTDACLLMGILDPAGFAGGEIRLDVEAAQASFRRLDSGLALDQRISYAYNIGLNNIAEGLTEIAVRHGIDPRDYTMVAYGAAGPMLLPALMDLVRVKRVIVPPHPGLFSALGLLSADLAYADSRCAYMILGADAAPKIDQLFADMEAELLSNIEGDREGVEVRRSFDGRLVGQTWETPFVPVSSGEITPAVVGEMVESFHQVYAERTGNRFNAIPVQGVTFRVQVVVPIDKVSFAEIGVTSDHAAVSDRTVTLHHLPGGEQIAQEYQRDALRCGDRILGPAIVREELSTTHITAGQFATVGRYGELVIEHN